MNTWKATLTIFIVSQSFVCHCSDKDTLIQNEKIYYTSLKDKLSIYLYGITKLNGFELLDSQDKNNLSYKPNDNFNIGLGFNYKWAGVGAAFNFGFINKDNSLYGKTTGLDFQADIYTRKVVYSANISSYKGFYWENVDDYYPGWNIMDSVIIRPDIRTFAMGLGAIYTFNDKRFSFRAAYSNTEWQKHSAGSMLAAGYLSLYKLNADSSLIPDMLHSYYPDYDSLTNLGTFIFGGAFGYTHTFVIKQKFYINGTLLIGITLQAYSTEDMSGNNIESKVKPSSLAHFSLAFGYNSDKSYFGISTVVDTYLLQNDNKAEFSRYFGKVRIFYGRRFNLNANREKSPEN